MTHMKMLLPVLFFLAVSAVRSNECFFTMEKNGFNAYHIEGAKITKSEYRSTEPILAFSGTKKGIAVAKGAPNASFEFRDWKQDFYVLTKVVIPDFAGIRKIAFSKDANHAAIAENKKTDCIISVYEKGNSNMLFRIEGNALTDELLFSSDGRSLIAWHPRPEEKRYIIKAYDIPSGKLKIEAAVEVPMGYSGLWPLKISCDSINDGIYTENTDEKFHKKYRRIDMTGHVSEISRENFLKRLGGMYIDGNTVYRMMDSRPEIVCRLDSFLDRENLVIKSAISPQHKYVAVATKRGYFFIDLKRKERISVSNKIFNDYFCWGGGN